MTIFEESCCILCSRSSKISCENCGAHFCCESHEVLHRNRNGNGNLNGNGNGQTSNENENENEKLGTCFPFRIQETEGVGRFEIEPLLLHSYFPESFRISNFLELSFESFTSFLLVHYHLIDFLFCFLHFTFLYLIFDFSFNCPYANMFNLNLLIVTDTLF